MGDKITFDYFYGGQEETFSYYRIPRVLFTGQQFKGLSIGAKMLYGLLLDRMYLSSRNGWYDDQGRVYIYYPVEEIEETMGCGHNKAVRLLAELDEVKGIGLIERIRQGLGKPAKIYVKQFTTRAVPDTLRGPAPDSTPQPTGFNRDRQGVSKKDLQGYHNRTSRLLETGRADVPKADGNYKNKNYPYAYLEPGNELKISAHIYFSTNQVNIAELVKMTPEQLKAAEMSSIAAEKAIFAQMSEIEKKWAKQAEQTMALRKAQEYLKTAPTPHTSNKWITSEYDWHEMSNMVYKFIWRIYENQRWSQEKQTSVTTSFDLSWYLSYNTPHNPDYSGPGRQIAGQERKHFGEKADLDRYLQGRINAYAHLFTEISPPIPSDQKKRFCVNGVLLPGYTVEVTREQKVSALLELLTDDDLADCGEAADPAVPPPIHFKTKASKKSSPTRDHKKKHVPTR